MTRVHRIGGIAVRGRECRVRVLPVRGRDVVPGGRVHVTTVHGWPLVHCMLPSDHVWVWLSGIGWRKSTWSHVRMGRGVAIRHGIT